MLLSFSIVDTVSSWLPLQYPVPIIGPSHGPSHRTPAGLKKVIQILHHHVVHDSVRRCWKIISKIMGEVGWPRRFHSVLPRSKAIEDHKDSQIMLVSIWVCLLQQLYAIIVLNDIVTPLILQLPQRAANPHGPIAVPLGPKVLAPKRRRLFSSSENVQDQKKKVAFPCSIHVLIKRQWR